MVSRSTCSCPQRLLRIYAYSSMKLPKWVWSSNRLYAPVNRTFFRRFPKSLYKKLMGSDPITKFLRCRRARSSTTYLHRKKAAAPGFLPAATALYCHTLAKNRDLKPLKSVPQQNLCLKYRETQNFRVHTYGYSIRQTLKKFDDLRSLPTLCRCRTSPAAR